jgi:alpha-amylase
MADLCLYFQVHQPDRLLPVAEMPGDGSLAYFDDSTNARILDSVAEHCYLPANRMFTRLIEKHSGRFRIAMSISGTLLDQLERHRPDVLASFRELVVVGGVELLAETYHHSLAFTHSNKEFDRQVDLHLERLEKSFHVRPRVFRNTGLVYNDAIAAKAETMGFDGILAEGVEANLQGRSPNFLYRAPETARIRSLLRNTRLSDDLGYRFSDRNWPGFPLTATTFAAWLADCPGDVVNLFLGYETIGEHHTGADGIFQFWENLPDAVEDAGLQWVTPSESVDLYRSAGEYPCTQLTSWMDEERDLSAWNGNAMQREAMERLGSLEKEVLATRDPALLDAWARLHTSNHFQWMSTKPGPAGTAASLMLPYPSPQDAHARFMRALDLLSASVTRFC